MHPTQHVFLVRPAAFSFNHETALSNSFQQLSHLTDEQLLQKVLQEFDAFAASLRAKNVDVLVFDDTPVPAKPDAIFPNNWISIQPDGSLILYPMCTRNRRAERRQDLVDTLTRAFQISRVIDHSGHEKNQQFLEGTGSIVFDHVNKVAYACLSARTDKLLFLELCAQLGYQAIAFHAYDQKGQAIYHTNVLMAVGAGFAVICLESITDKNERSLVEAALKSSGLEIVEISFAQMNAFCGNMLQLQTSYNVNLLVMSKSSFQALNTEQKNTLSKYSELLPLSIPTIETVGGGSVRCMIAEIFCAPRS